MDAFVTGTLPQKTQIEVDVDKQKSGRKKTRKYDSGYLNFGFTVAEKEGSEHPQCVIRCKVLAAEYMLPSKLKRHLTANHHNLSGKLRQFFARKLSGINKQSVIFSNFCTHLPRHSLRLLKLRTESRNVKNRILLRKNSCLLLLLT